MGQRLKRQRAAHGKRIATHETAPTGTDHMPPVFGFDQMRSGYDVEACHRAGRSQELLEALWRRSKLPWRDLLIADHEKNGFEPVPQSLLTRSEIPGMTPDQKLLVLRFAGSSARIIGYREGRIYHVLWVDNDLSLYRH